MDLTAFTRLLARRGWIVVACAVLGAAIGLAYALTATPIYQATTRVSVQAARPADLGQTQAIKEIMRSYQEDILTVDMATAVVARLAEAGDRCCPLCLTPGELLRHGVVSSDENVYEIRIGYRSPEPATAVCVSEKWAETFIDRREKANRQLDLRDRILASIRDRPQPDRSAPQRRQIVLLAALVGAALGAALLLLLEYLGSAFVRDARDAERVAGPLIGTVPADRGRRAAGGAIRLGWRRLAAGSARLVRVGWPVVLMAAIGAATALALSLVRPPVWQARTRIVVEPAQGSNWGQTQAIPETIRAYTEDIHTLRMAGEVGDALELDLPPEQLLGQLAVAAKAEVYEIHLDVRDPISTTARAMSHEWARRFVEQQTAASLQLDQPDRILTRLRDQTSLELWAPKVVINTAAGALLGALLGAAAIFLLYQLGARMIQTAADAGRAAGAPVVGTIPRGEGGF
jgi:capsular polysaccharide biosynthesis protein